MNHTAALNCHITGLSDYRTFLVIAVLDDLPRNDIGEPWP